MDFLHYEFTLETRDRVHVTLDRAANVMLLDTVNYSNYRVGKDCAFYGGRAKQSPVVITAPHRGHWHVVIDLDGKGGTVRASVQVIHD